MINSAWLLVLFPLLEKDANLETQRTSIDWT
jgi:hypothetical protein